MAADRRWAFNVFWNQRGEFTVASSLTSAPTLLVHLLWQFVPVEQTSRGDRGQQEREGVVGGGSWFVCSRRWSWLHPEVGQSDAPTSDSMRSERQCHNRDFTIFGRRDSIKPLLAFHHHPDMPSGRPADNTHDKGYLPRNSGKSVFEGALHDGDMPETGGPSLPTSLV
jgi:hypothetical protein